MTIRVFVLLMRHLKIFDEMYSGQSVIAGSAGYPRISGGSANDATSPNTNCSGTDWWPSAAASSPRSSGRRWLGCTLTIAGIDNSSI